MPQQQTLTSEMLRIFESVPDLYLILSPDLHILTASDAYLQATFTRRADIVGKFVFEVFPDNPGVPQVNATGSLHASLQQVLSSRKPHQMALQRYDVPRPLEQGGGFEEKYWHPINTPVLDEQGEVLYIIHKVSDVTESVKSQEQIGDLTRREEAALLAVAWEQQKLQALFMQAPVAVAIFSGSNYEVELINPLMSQLAGRPASELLGKPLFEAMPEAKGQGFEKILSDVFTSGVPYKTQEIPATLKRDGRLIKGYYNVVYQPLRNAQQQITGIIQISTDVSDQVEARRRLEESKEKYRSLFETMEQGFCILEMIFDANDKPVDYRFLEVNPVFEQQTGLKAPAGKTARELVPNLEAHWFEIYGKVALTGEAARFTEGSAAMGRWFDVYAFRIGRNESRKVALLFTDVTERKQVEESLRQTNSWFQLVNRATQDAIWDWDLLSRQIRWNEGLQSMFNYKPEEIACDENWWYEHIHPLDRQRVVTSIHEVIDGGKEHWSDEYRFQAGDGGYKIVYDRGFVLHDEAGKAVRMIGSMQDVTDRKWAEEALKQSEAHFRTFADNIQNLAWMAAPDGWIYWYNQTWYDYTGTTFEEMQGWGWEKVHHPDYLEQIRNFVKEAWHKGETWELIFPLRGADGQYRWFITRAHADKDADGRVVRWIGTNTNIDEQKRAESSLAEKNRELVRINNDLDNFIYTASHDLRAPILNIEGLVSVLNKSLGPEASAKGNVQKLMGLIYQSINRFKETIKDLTEVAKVQNSGEEDVAEVSFEEMLDDVKLNIKSLIEASHAVIHDDFSEASSIYFSRKNLRSILYNLVSNAIKYQSPERAAEVRVSTSRSDGGHILLSVQDNGLGIREKDKSKVFKMFTRLHQHVEGSGVGMSIVKKIVDNNGGKIEIESKLGEGSLFKVYLKV